MPSSRRHFLQRASLAASALAFAPRISAWADTPAAAGSARAWITSGADRFKPVQVQAGGTGPETIEVRPSQRFQSILGFGGAFTDASCYLFGRMDQTARRQLLAELLGPEGLQLSVGRTCIGSSDYSRTAYSFDDSQEPDPELKKFSIDHDRAYILPALREARAVNPELFLFSAPWSPPGWMKSSNTLLGGTMVKEHLGAYAEYFVKFLQGYHSEGVPIAAVTSQNEVDTNQDGKMPACLWGQEYETAFVKEFLGPALRKAGLDTKIWLLDHNYDLWGRVLDQLSDPVVASYVDGVAWHGYMGSPATMTRVHNAYPDKGMYWTEGGPDYKDADYTTDWAKWSSTFTGILKNWARCIVSWNLLLDENGSPNIGPFSCGGLVTIDSKTHALTRSGMYWAFAHYSKLVRRDAQVVATEGNLAGVEHVAFLNPAGDCVLVLTNKGEQREVSCAYNGKTAQVNLPANSIATLQWS